MVPVFASRTHKKSEMWVASSLRTCAARCAGPDDRRLSSTSRPTMKTCALSAGRLTCQRTRLYAPPAFRTRALNARGDPSDARSRKCAVVAAMSVWCISELNVRPLSAVRPQPRSRWNEAPTRRNWPSESSTPSRSCDRSKNGSKSLVGMGNRECILLQAAGRCHRNQKRPAASCAGSVRQSCRDSSVRLWRLPLPEPAQARGARAPRWCVAPQGCP